MVALLSPTFSHTGSDLPELNESCVYARRELEPNLGPKDTGDSPKGDEVLRGLAYDPLKHPPLLVPTTVSGGENITWPDFLWATEQAQGGKACVLTFHGVPDTNYPWVDTPAEFFERCMR